MVDAKTREVDTLGPNWWPRIYGNNYPNSGQDTSDNFFGTRPLLLSYNAKNWLSDKNDTLSSNDLRCLFSVRGRGRFKTIDTAYSVSSRVIIEDFSRENYGQRISFNNIFEFDNPSSTYLLEQFELLSNKYKTLNFYYTGDADTSGGLMLSDGILPFINLVNNILERNIFNLNFIFDCNFSGKAIKSLWGNPLTYGHNIDIITSSGKNDVSEITYFELTMDDESTDTTGIGSFTHSFASYYPPIDIGTDFDAKVEHLGGLSFNYLQIPLSSGKIIQDYNPQIYSFRSIETNRAVFDYKDIDLKVTFDTPPGNGIYFNTTLRLGEILFDFTPNDDIYFASQRRLWTLNLTDTTLNFKANLEFKLNNKWDTLPTVGNGIPGMIYRESMSDNWKAHFPSDYNSTLGTITALGVRRFSQWAIAMVKEQVQPVIENPEISQYHLNSFPNPFSDASTLHFSLDNTSNVNIVLFDASGVLVKNIVSGDFASGEHYISFDADGLSAGVYFAKVTANNDIMYLKVIQNKL